MASKFLYFVSFLLFYEGEKEMSAVQDVLCSCCVLLSSALSCACVRVCLTDREKKCVEFDACCFSQHFYSHEYIYNAARCQSEVLGAGLCVCERGERQAVYTAPKQTRLFFIKIVQHLHQFFHKSTF